MAQPRFAVGTQVRIDDRTEDRHHRVPAYAKGQIGTIAKVCGEHEEPERIAYGETGYPSRLYRVRLQQTQLWPAYDGPASDTLDIEIFEHWLVGIERDSGNDSQAGAR